MTRENKLFSVTVLPEDTDTKCDCTKNKKRAIVKIVAKQINQTSHMCAGGLEDFVLINIMKDATNVLKRLRKGGITKIED